MSDTEKIFTYEETKELCKKAFIGGATYEAESTRYGVNAIAYDWDHWFQENKDLLKSAKPTVESVLAEFADEWIDVPPYREPEIIAKYAAKLRLAGDAE